MSEAPAATGFAEVRRALSSRLPDASSGIQARWDAGVVTLSGTVDAYPKKAIAAEAVAGVPGVLEVNNHLQVTAEPRTDDELARDATWTLRADPATTALGVRVSAKDGRLTLHGTVDTVPQKRIAAWVVSGLRGVRDLQNKIVVAPQARTDQELHDELLQHFATSPLFRDDNIAVQVQDGVVGLSGRVSDALEKNWARSDAWIRGVREVHADQLGIEHSLTRTRTPAHALSDASIRQTIIQAFEYDPRIASVNLTVSVDHGVVALSGQVDNRRARRAAVQITESTGGVSRVIDRLTVKSPHPRSDTDVADSLRTALRSSAALHGNPVTVDVHDGHVRLSGTVDSDYEKWLATDLADRTTGVQEVDNAVKVSGREWTPRSEFYFYPTSSANAPWIFPRAWALSKSDSELKTELRQLLQLSPRVDANHLTITVNRGLVTLRGNLSSATARGEALFLAYEAGARDVINEIQIGQQSS